MARNTVESLEDEKACAIRPLFIFALGLSLYARSLGGAKICKRET
jgi:hypothetical protein